MLGWMVMSAWAGVATLDVAVHREAGTIADIAADGASGACTLLGSSRIVCPAEGPVSFRFGPSGTEFVLHGDTVVEPGQFGTGVVLPANGTHEALRTELLDPTPTTVREAFIRTSERSIPIVSPNLFADLLALTRNSNPDIRVIAVRGLIPYVRHTASDPFPAGAPSLLPSGWADRLIRDPDKRVRRRAAALLREVRTVDPGTFSEAAALTVLLDDPDRRVRKLALKAQTEAALEERVDALDAWNDALTRIHQPGPAGRAAAMALAALRHKVPVDAVDPDGALALILRHQPEKAWRFWTAWRSYLPFHGDRVRLLLRDTSGLSRTLLRDWARDEPVHLASALSDWEPALPHSRRFGVIRTWLSRDVTDPVLLRVLLWDDTMSVPMDPPLVE